MQTQHNTTTPKLSAAQMQAEIDRLNAVLATRKSKAVTFKVTEPKFDPKTQTMKGTKGAVSAYGLGQFPITLYASQWDKLLASFEELKKFMDTNKAKLAYKE